MTQENQDLPTIKIVYDEQAQGVAIQFEPTEFKSWEFIIACLDMARSQAEFHRDMQRGANLQHAQQQAMQAAQLRNKLKF